MPTRDKVRLVLVPALAGLLLVGFVAALGLGATLRPRQTGSTLDGRVLAGFPDPSAGTVRSGQWMTDMEGWIDDHIPARTRWLQWHAEIARDALRQPVLKSVYTRDPKGMLLQEVPPLTVPADLGTNAATLGSQVRALGVKTLSVYVPRREEVFADRLPSGWSDTLAVTKPAVLQDLSRFGPVLDLSGPLSDPATRDGYWWHTDHHWTPAGALAALGSITRAAAGLGVTIPPDTRPYASHTYRPFYGSLGREVTSGGTRPDTFRIPLPAQLRAHVCSGSACTQPTFVTSVANDPDRYTNRYTAFMGGDVGYQVTQNPSPQAHGRILLVKDSFGDALSTYLAERVSALALVDERHYTGPNIVDLVRSFKPDLVIVMHNQVTMLGNSFFDSGIWVDVQAALARREHLPASATDDG